MSNQARKKLFNLAQLYQAHEVQDTWNAAKGESVIEHPDKGLISPNQYRQMGSRLGKRCPYCGQKMTYGDSYKASSREEAIKKGFEYINKQGQKTINKAQSIFFDRKYLTLDHKLTKARCPERMFDFDNLQFVCWECNQEKGSNNAFDVQYIFDYLDSLATEALNRYKPL